MNEHQVIMGEATWTGRDENYCPNGWMMIEQLQVFGLQRAKRLESYQSHDRACRKYGYGDGGETLLVIDKNEGWIFDICGRPLWTPESRKPGAIWLHSVSGDCNTVVANRTRIGTIDWDDKKTYVFFKYKSFAQEMGWWKPGEPFVFHKSIILNHTELLTINNAGNGEFKFISSLFEIERECRRNVSSYG